MCPQSLGKKEQEANLELAGKREIQHVTRKCENVMQNALEATGQ